ncbi:MAG: hypothetical protein COV52_06640 [Gammaproteobacteria bacterium CG11_big_fil_rev_8_21_14_0_20_46_22]|nr:MAG: hypothetical protein COW05_00685 [Gammaproteobacteria bacterium CG12_big_fil_rev_8_21_14_0_65_46_12]PIR10916.1 MAG: hypothetical protein COV52_06640 [Gammaproteobacteria bacterium CG11_big_fil_rev_8_21_14_0_20_46_22]
MHSVYETFTHWLFQHVYWAAFFTFLIAFLESLIIIGTIIPGSITMTAVGIMMGAGVINIPLSLCLAIAGAFIGDGLSYFIGYRFRDTLPSKWPFRLVPKLIQKGKAYFAEHGGKSVFIGRFVGAIRAMVPVVAGMMHMKPWHYFPISFCSAILWAIVYLIPGFLIGFASEALPPGLATHVILYVLGFLVLIWLIYWAIKEFSILFGRMIDKFLDRCWNKLYFNRRWHWLTRLIQNAQDPGHHGQFVMTVMFIVSAALFITLSVQVIFQHGLTSLNAPILHIMRGLRDVGVQKFMIFISILGDEQTLLPAILFTSIVLWFKRYRHAAIHLFMVTFIGCLIAWLMKEGIPSARPSGIAFIKATGSYPSGHTVLAVLCFGYVAWLVGHSRPSFKKVSYWIASAMIALLFLSRLYLCDHWFTDVIGSLFLGLTVVFGGIISYKRFQGRNFTPKTLLLPFLLFFALFAAINMIRNFHSLYRHTQLVWQDSQLSQTQWWKTRTIIIGRYSKTALNRNEDFLNLQWAGKLDTIIRDLHAHNWVVFVRKKTLENQNTPHQLLQFDLMPNLYESRLPSSVLVNNHMQPSLVLRLWKSDVTLSPSNTPLWVGSITYNERPKHILQKNKAADMQDMLKGLLPSLESDYRWKIINNSLLIIEPKNLDTPT